MNFNLLPHELIIDNFAGGGGTSTGLEQAFNRPVDVAINHDPKALAMHRINHPSTKHYCESVWDIDPIQVTGNQPVGLVWLSPDCKHFSKAKGGKPVEKRIRGLAWVALRWAAKTRPRIIMLENVEEFKTWGDLGEDGRPCPKRKGRTFNCFVNALKRQGYNVQWKELRACDFGSPTIRKRFFLVARRDGLPIVWPSPTHAHPDSDQVKKGQLLPWRTAAECIDWSIPCQSIFERTKPLADATLERIALGLKRFVIENPSPYIVQDVTPFLAGTGGGKYSAKPTAINRPIGTLVASGNYKAVITPVLTECANASNKRCMPINEPLRTICAQTKGGHHALIAPTLVVNTTNHPGNKLDNPLHTIATGGHHGLVSAFLAKNYTGVVGSDLKEPLHTITAKDHNSLVTVFLTAFYGNEKSGNSLSDPLRTVTAKCRFGLVTINKVQYRIVDIGFRMLHPCELFKAQGFPDDYIFTYGMDENGQKVNLTKSEQTRMVGNSVCPQVARALIEANFRHEKKYRGAA